MRRIMRVSLIGLAFAAIPISSALAIYRPWETSDRLSVEIKKLGFYPLSLPTLLRPPGSIYHVSSDGRTTTALCLASHDRIKKVTRESRTPDTFFNEVTSGHFQFGAKSTEVALSTSDANILQSVNYTLSKTKMLEISLGDLAEIADELLKRPACQREVLAYLKAGAYVCQVQAVLLANATYTVSKDGEAGGVASIKELRSVINANIDAKARSVGTHGVVGNGLYYGIKFPPHCLALPGQSPAPLVTGWYERAKGLFFGRA